MSSFAMRSRLAGLAGLASKPFLHSRVFSTAPVYRLPFNVGQAIQGELDLNWTPEIITPVGVCNALIYDSHTDCSDAASLARIKASLAQKDAINYNLLFTSDHLGSLPKLDFDAWRLQAATARKIVKYHQHQALLRAGISNPWYVCMYNSMDDPFAASIAFRLPKQETPGDFEQRLRAAGLVGGEFEVCPRSADFFWVQCLQLLGESV